MLVTLAQRAPTIRAAHLVPVAHRALLFLAESLSLVTTCPRFAVRTYRPLAPWPTRSVIAGAADNIAGPVPTRLSHHAGVLERGRRFAVRAALRARAVAAPLGTLGASLPKLSQADTFVGHFCHQGKGRAKPRVRARHRGESDARDVPGRYGTEVATRASPAQTRAHSGA